MHSKARYEETITGKLAALPLPDMADAIWTRIEQQLDIDLPSDGEGDVPELPSAPDGGLPVIAGSSMLLFIGALLTYSYFESNPQQNSLPQNTSVQPKAPNKIPVQKASIIQTKNPQNSTAFYPGRNMPVTDVPLSLPKTNAASEHELAAAMPPPDSGTATTHLTAMPPLVVPETKKDSSIHKPRGMQGISNNDYRIVPKKDST